MGDVPFKSMTARAFCNATELDERVLEALRNVVGDAEVSVEETEGHSGNRLLILTADIRRRHVRVMFDRMLAIVPQLIEESDDRLDEENSFHIRLDKQAAFTGEMRLARRGDVISISGKVESYPRNREVALTSFRSFLDEVQSSTGSTTG